MECIIAKETVDELLCIGYKRSYWKTALSFIGSILSAGFLWLIFYWREDWKLKCTHTKTNLSQATSVLLQTTDDSDQTFVSQLQEMPSELALLVSRSYPGSKPNPIGQQDATFTFFHHHCSKYIWDNKQNTFVELGGLENNVTLEQIHQNSTSGLNEIEIERRSSLFGNNLITVQIPSYFKLLVSEILNPFYVFQLFAVIFWMFDEYYTYATAIFIISLISAVVSLLQVRRERVNLHNMVKYHNETTVKVQRQDSNSESGVKEIEVWSSDLVPGDVIIVPSNGMQLPCDSALVSGTCIVNESMLTGESVPVTKTPLPSSEREMKNFYITEENKRHTLFCGTQVLQTRFYRGELVKAVVVRTGYHTAKGRLVHSILFPKPVDMKLLRDAYNFVLILVLIAMCGFIYTVVIQHLQGESARDIAFNAIDLITISVPPALPLAMTIGIVYAQTRLKRQRIHCISPQRINISGQVDVVAFDKTGTLTEDGLDLAEVIPVDDKSMQSEFRDPVLSENLQNDFSLDSRMLHGMLTCHTLTTIDGKLTGDPMDLILFKATGWNLVEPSVEDESKYDQLQTTYVRPSLGLLQGQSTFIDSMPSLLDNVEETSNSTPYDIGIVRQFPFSSNLQRASVIVKPYKSKPKELVVYMKGSPEMVASLCRSETLPHDFKGVLQRYTQQGYRMIGMAYKEVNLSWLKAQKIERDTIENGLTFLGLISLQNKLKTESMSSLAKLKRANIRTLMVTGDNLLTALSVAREADMIGANDVILLSSTSCDENNQTATLNWSFPEKFGVRNRTDSKLSDESSPFSSTDMSVSKQNQISICMGEQLPQNWYLGVSGHDYSIIKKYFPEWMEVLATKGMVFARMSPSQKTDLMEELQGVDYHVCMCGDGANDCGALKRAHAGLSLSEYEASVAAPFTSHTEMGIESVPTLIREGRAALVTSFGMFKYMALYSLIQFTSVTLLYNDLSNLSDLMYLYIDLIIIDVVAITMSRNYAHKKLHHKKPPSSLVSVEMLVSLFFHIFLQVGTQIFVFFYIKEQCWFTELTPAEAANTTVGNITTCPQLANVKDQSEVEDDYNVLTYETSAIFYLSAFLYMNVSVAFSRGKPFRTPIYKNKSFLISLVLLCMFTVFLMFWAPLEMNNFIELRMIPDNFFLGIVLAVAAVHFVVAVGFEMMVVENYRLWSLILSLPIITMLKSSKAKKRYKVIQNYFSGVDVPSETIPNPLDKVGMVIKSRKCIDSVVHKTQL